MASVVSCPRPHTPSKAVYRGADGGAVGCDLRWARRMFTVEKNSCDMSVMVTHTRTSRAVLVLTKHNTLQSTSRGQHWVFFVNASGA